MINFAKLLRNKLISIIDWFYLPFQNYLPLETFRYGTTWGLNTCIDITLYYIFYNFIFDKNVLDLGFVAMGAHIAAFVFVFPITFTIGFIFAKYVTFTQSVLKGRIQLFRYGVSVGGSILLNYVLLKLFVETFHWYATVSKIVTTFIVIIYSYIVQKHFTFRTGKKTLAKNSLYV